MVALGVAGFVIGLILGRRVTAFALLPVELAALSVAIYVAVVGHAGWASSLFGFVCFWLSSQTSYAVALALPAVLRNKSQGPA